MAACRVGSCDTGTRWRRDGRCWTGSSTLLHLDAAIGRRASICGWDESWNIVQPQQKSGHHKPGNALLLAVDEEEPKRPTAVEKEASTELATRRSRNRD